MTIAGRRAGIGCTFALASSVLAFAPLAPTANAAAQVGRALAPTTSLRPASVVGDTHPLKDVRGATQANDTLLVLILDEGGGCRRLRLPVGRELLSIGAASLVAKSIDDLGVERVERYRMADVDSHAVRC